MKQWIFILLFIPFILEGQSPAASGGIPVGSGGVVLQIDSSDIPTSPPYVPPSNTITILKYNDLSKTTRLNTHTTETDQNTMWGSSDLNISGGDGADYDYDDTVREDNVVAYTLADKLECNTELFDNLYSDLDRVYNNMSRVYNDISKD